MIRRLVAMGRLWLCLLGSWYRARSYICLACNQPGVSSTHLYLDWQMRPCSRRSNVVDLYFLFSILTNHSKEQHEVSIIMYHLALHSYWRIRCHSNVHSWYSVENSRKNPLCHSAEAARPSMATKISLPTMKSHRIFFLADQRPQHPNLLTLFLSQHSPNRQSMHLCKPALHSIEPWKLPPYILTRDAPSYTEARKPRLQ